MADVWRLIAGPGCCLVLEWSHFDQPVMTENVAEDTQ